MSKDYADCMWAQDKPCTCGGAACEQVSFGQDDFTPALVEDLIRNADGELYRDLWKHSHSTVGKVAKRANEYRAVAEQAYWLLAWSWQSHLFDAGKPFDMSIFAPEARDLMNKGEQDLFDALSALSNSERTE